jgi:hypothetical protein
MKPRSLFQIACAVGTVLFVTQCALPPREAWRQVQSKGLFTYLGSMQSGQATTPYRPDQLGTGLWRKGVAPYSGRYTSLNYGNRYNQSAPISIPKRKVASSSKPAPKPKPKTQRVASSSSSTSSGSSAAKAKTKPKPEASVASKPSKPEKKSEPDPAPTQLTEPGAELPYGRIVSGRSGLVNSPYAGSSQLVDVTGMSAGQPVKCPYTGKLFRVPAGAQASNGSGE